MNILFFFQRDALRFVENLDVYSHRSTNKCLYPYETGYVLANYVVDKYDVTAIVGNNDAVSLGIIDALHYRKIKVPQDYSVCGCDNTYISGLKDISLTTVEKFTELRSREAVDILIKKIRQSSSDSSKYKLPISAIKVEYEPQIVARQSTGPSRKTK